MHFDNKLKEYFLASTGAYSDVTDREFYDSQLTLTGAEADLVELYFHKDNIHIGSVKSNPQLSAKKFLLYPEFSEIELNLTYPKASKSELRLYLSSKRRFKPNAGDIFFVYLNATNRLVIGFMKVDEWKQLSDIYQQSNLFDFGEELDSDEDDIEELGPDEEDPFDQNIDSDALQLSSNLPPFDPTKIDIDTKTPSLDTLIKRIQRGNIEMDTSKYFQRRDDLWNNEKQSRLIESILIRFPLPAFYFDSTNDENWLIVDGLQRLSSVRNFCVDKTLRLEKLEFLKQLNGKTWNELSGDLQRLIEETQVVLYKIMPGTPTDVKFNIFRRINTGGISLSSQEIRHALFQGIPADFLFKLAKSEKFIDATLGSIPTKRMADRDYVNRYLSFYLLGYKSYQADLDTFMSRAMGGLYNKSDSELLTIERNFNEAMSLAVDIFGRMAFRRPSKFSERLTPLNKALFDAIASQFGLLSESDRTKLKNNKKTFFTDFNKLLENDNYFIISITSSTGDRKRVNYRHNKVEQLITEILNK